MEAKGGKRRQKKAKGGKRRQQEAKGGKRRQDKIFLADNLLTLQTGSKRKVNYKDVIEPMWSSLL